MTFQFSPSNLAQVVQTTRIGQGKHPEVPDYSHLLRLISVVPLACLVYDHREHSFRS